MQRQTETQSTYMYVYSDMHFGHMSWKSVEDRHTLTQIIALATSTKILHRW